MSDKAVDTGQLPAGKESPTLACCADSDFPETDRCWDSYQQDALSEEGDPWKLAAKLERERNEARRFAEAYREVWEKCSAAVDETPNPDSLPWHNRDCSPAEE